MDQWFSRRQGHAHRQWTAAVLSLSLFLPVSLSAQAVGPGVFAITGARIVTVTNGTLEKGTVVFRDGLIEAVGEQVTVPEDARVIDGSGLTVYPGLIDAHSGWALDEPQSSPGRGPGARSTQGASAERPGMNPAWRASDYLSADESKFDKVRRVGITTALTIPRNGILMGQSTLVNLAGEKPARMIVKSPVAMHMGFDTSGGFRTYPGSLMGVISYLRQTCLDAGHYHQEWERYERIQRGVRRPEPDPALESLQPVLAGRMPVIFSVEEEKEIRRAIELAEEFGLKVILSGMSEGHAVTELLRDKGIPALVSLNVPTQPKDVDPDADVPLRVLRVRADASKTAAALHRAGIMFAFTSGFMSDPQIFLRNASEAIRAGLPETEAVKALTINSAEILGIREQLGSIEPGKIANLIVTDGNLFEEKTKMIRVFIDGREINMEKPSEPRNRPARSSAGDVSGMWDFSITTPREPIPATAAMKQSGELIDATMTSPSGKSDGTERVTPGSAIQLSTLMGGHGQPVLVRPEGTIENRPMKWALSDPGQSDFECAEHRPL